MFLYCGFVFVCAVSVSVYIGVFMCMIVSVSDSLSVTVAGLFLGGCMPEVVSVAGCVCSCLCITFDV